MKRIAYLLLAAMLLLSAAMTAFAADGNVTYTGDAGKCIFAPGSEYSLTDLFPNFKDVMPGDSLTQTITVHNKASDKVRIKIYIRSLGAHADSEQFLSQMRLRVEKSANNTMAYMFDAAASQSAQLTEWTLLGTLYSGGTVNLDVILDVPVEMDNEFQNRVGYLDWEFMIEEENVQPGDPEPPKTGDDSPLLLWAGLMALSLVLLILLLASRKKKKED